MEKTQLKIKQKQKVKNLLKYKPKEKKIKKN